MTYHFRTCPDCDDRAYDVAAKLASEAHRGEHRAIRAREIERDLDFGGGDGRRAREIVEHLRAVHRAPICSTATNGAPGFFWPTSREDTEHTSAAFRSRLGKMQATLRGFEAGRDELWPAQDDLFGRGVSRG